MKSLDSGGLWSAILFLTRVIKLFMVVSGKQIAMLFVRDERRLFLGAGGGGGGSENKRIKVHVK